MDSRPNAGFADAETRTRRVTGRYGVPSTATAVVANVTAVSRRTPGCVTVWPSGSAQPPTSSLNFGSLAIVPNRIVSGLGPDGALKIYASRSTDLIVDITGWFGGADGSRFYLIQPTRVVESRSGIGTGLSSSPISAGSALDVDLTTTVPPDAVSAAITVTGTRPQGATSVTAWPGGQQPPTSDLNLGTVTAANMSLEELIGGHFLVRPNSAATHLIVDVTGYFGRPGAGSASRLRIPSPSESPAKIAISVAPTPASPTTTGSAAGTAAFSPSASHSG